jgi:hypothetical protein
MLRVMKYSNVQKIVLFVVSLASRRIIWHSVTVS